MESALSDPEAVSGISGDVADGPLVGAARTVESAARDVRQKVVHAKEQLARKSVGELVEDGRGFVRENPVKAVLISVGIGALVGYVLGRRRS